MNDGASFLVRWARRKANARRAAGGPAPSPMPVAEAGQPVAAGQPPTASAVADPTGATAAPEPEPLPPVESLGAASDYTAFLKPDVPPLVRRDALRRAWVTDPVIADFRSPADYDWDFNAPGYGLLRAADDVGKLLAAVFPEPEPARPPVPPESAEAAPTDPIAAPTAEPPAAISSPPPTTIRAAVEVPTPPPAAPVATSSGTPALEPPPLPRRRHGGALPR